MPRSGLCRFCQRYSWSSGWSLLGDRHNPAGIACGLPVWSGQCFLQTGERAWRRERAPAASGLATVSGRRRCWRSSAFGWSGSGVCQRRRSRCYGDQVKAFLAAIGGPEAVRGLDAGQVTAFMVDHSRDRNSWSAKAMVTSLRAFLRFAHVTGRTLVPLAGAVPAVASWRLAALPQGLPAADRCKPECPARRTRR